MPPVTGDPGESPLLSVEDLVVSYPATGGWRAPAVRAVDGVSFQVRRGEILGLVGESGCGKSTTALAVLRLLDPESGRIVLDGEDITGIGPARMRPVRRRMQAVFQDPFGSLDPRMTVRDIVAEPLDVHGLAGDRAARSARVAELLEQVGLRADMAGRHPHEFSGGQRQRIGIARAIALRPALVVCDEPVSALDVSVQAQITNLLLDIRERSGVAYLFIAHDLAVVRHISDRVAVMYLGRIAEIASADDLFRTPRHPYTQALLAAVPMADPVAERARSQALMTDEVPSALSPPTRCRFHPRCPGARPVCHEVVPALKSVDGGHAVACHLVEPTGSDGSDHASRRASYGPAG